MGKIILLLSPKSPQTHVPILPHNPCAARAARAIKGASEQNFTSEERRQPPAGCPPPPRPLLLRREAPSAEGPGLAPLRGRPGAQPRAPFPPAAAPSPKPLMSSVKTPGSLSMRHHSPALLPPDMAAAPSPEGKEGAREGRHHRHRLRGKAETRRSLPGSPRSPSPGRGRAGPGPAALPPPSGHWGRPHPGPGDAVRAPPGGAAGGGRGRRGASGGRCGSCCPACPSCQRCRARREPELRRCRASGAALGRAGPDLRPRRQVGG